LFKFDDDADGLFAVGFVTQISYLLDFFVFD